MKINVHSAEFKAAVQDARKQLPFAADDRIASMARRIIIEAFQKGNAKG